MTWRTAHSDPEIQKFPTLDILLAFEEQIRAQAEKIRKERKTREGFKVCVALIPHPTADSRWYTSSGSLARTCGRPSIHFKDDECYPSILGSPGSGPPEFFWNTIGAMDQKLEGKIEITEGPGKRYNEKYRLQVTSDEGYTPSRKCLDYQHPSQMPPSSF